MPSGEHLWKVHSGSDLTVHSTKDGRVVATFDHSFPTLAASGDNTRIFTIDTMGRVKEIDTRTGALTDIAKAGSGAGAWMVRASGDGQLVYASGVLMRKIYRVDTGEGTVASLPCGGVEIGAPSTWISAASSGPSTSKISASVTPSRSARRTGTILQSPWMSGDTTCF